ncbi:MAG: hypothetical protein J0H74_10470 [Chitinophagaceae bacterium]|nr:hypothetical protein [Chitinophagaceae bacterium]
MKILTGLFLMLTVLVRQDGFAQGDLKKLTARTYNSGFAIGHDTYNAISAASDGKIYYVLSSQSIDTGGQMYSFDPGTGRIHHCGDLTEACGEKGLKTIAQGKSHVRFVESNGKLYFATHVGYYSMVDGMEKMGIPPPGYKAYPGGHILAYDMKTGKFDDLAIAPHQEGILTMNMDTKRGLIYCITWPTGYVFRYDVGKKELKEIGLLSGEGENGSGKDFRVLCRSLAINPTDGAVYATTSEGTIFCLKSGSNVLEPLEEDMRKDYFGIYDPASAGSMGYNWRQTVWYPGNKTIYGVHGNSGYLFQFDPRAERVRVLDRITSEPSKRSGMFDQFSYGYLGFILGPDQHTLYYLTGGPVYKEGHRVKGKNSTAMGEAKGLEDLHLVTYDLLTGKYRDRGAVFYPDGQRPVYVNSIAVGKDGTVYTLARITENGKTRTDLVSIGGVK